MAISDTLENARIIARRRPHLIMFNFMPMSSKSATCFQANAHCPVADNPNISYEEIDTTFDECKINCTSLDNSQNTAIADEMNTTYEEIDIIRNEPKTNDNGLTDAINKINATYEDVGSGSDEYEEPNTSQIPSLQVDAIAICMAASLSRPPDEPNTAHSEYDELDAPPPPGLQASAININTASFIPQSFADSQPPFGPSDSVQENAGDTHFNKR